VTFRPGPSLPSYHTATDLTLPQLAPQQQSLSTSVAASTDRFFHTRLIFLFSTRDQSNLHPATHSFHKLARSTASSPTLSPLSQLAPPRTNMPFDLFSVIHDIKSGESGCDKEKKPPQTQSSAPKPKTSTATPRVTKKAAADVTRKAPAKASSMTPKPSPTPRPVAKASANASSTAQKPAWRPAGVAPATPRSPLPRSPASVQRAAVNTLDAPPPVHARLTSPRIQPPVRLIVAQYLPRRLCLPTAVVQLGPYPLRHPVTSLRQLQLLVVVPALHS
jgi:hypothetical protein